MAPTSEQTIFYVQIILSGAFEKAHYVSHVQLVRGPRDSFCANYS